jgi:hypothetical protein
MDTVIQVAWAVYIDVVVGLVLFISWLVPQLFERYDVN